MSIADTLSDAAFGIHEYLELGDYDHGLEDEIRRVLAEMESLRERLDHSSITAVFRDAKRSAEL